MSVGSKKTFYYFERNFTKKVLGCSSLELFVLTFWSCKRNGLIRKIKLIQKFMTSQHS